MNYNYPSPWDFSNTDANLISPDGQYRIEYEDLREIGMGAPISGKCFLVTPDQRIQINDMCGGPAVWNTSGTKVALPLWERDLRQGYVCTYQRIVVINIDEMNATIFNETFRVLDLKSFIGGVIQGVDSPVHKSAIIGFNTDQEQIEKIIPIGGGFT